MSKEITITKDSVIHISSFSSKFSVTKEFKLTYLPEFIVITVGNEKHQALKCNDFIYEALKDLNLIEFHKADFIISHSGVYKDGKPITEKDSPD